MCIKKINVFFIALAISLINVLFIALIISVLAFSVFDSGYDLLGQKQPSDRFDETLLPGQTTIKPPAELPLEFSILVETWDMLTENYVDKSELDARKLSQGAVKGMIDALDDPYSAYVDPEIYKLELNSLSGKYQGIGAYVGIREKQLTIIAPIAGSPAEESNLRPGDKILEINGEDTSGMNISEAALKIQGPEGTSVKLLILREDDGEPMEINIVRREITLKSVHWELRDHMAYIRITGLLRTTGNDLSSALKDIGKEDVDGIILDLRNNPGGLLNIAVDVASQFLADGIVVDVVDSEGKHSPLPVKRGGLATDLPLIVLVNGGSASGSEVIAGALQDYGRAKLAGSQTFGKGSVQLIRNLEDGSALHITIARWFTPFGRPIEQVGLTPDFPLDLEGEELITWAIDYLKNQLVVSNPSTRV